VTCALCEGGGPYSRKWQGDAEYFNKPIEHYAAMALIYRNSMATEKYEKSSGEPLGEASPRIECAEQESHDVSTTSSDGNAISNTINDEQPAPSSATRPNKRAKTNNFEVDSLVGAFTSSSNRLATTMKKLAQGNMDLPGMMKTLSGFNNAHISFYYSYLVANSHIERAFYKLSFDAKMDWMVEFITAKFPEK
jgi:hypothetical protein